MRIGSVEIAAPLALAPMAGVTDGAFRRICAEMGAAGAKRAQDFSVERYYQDFVRIVHEVLQNGGAS